MSGFSQFSESLEKHNKIFLIITIAVAAFYSFWKFSNASVNEWDEARLAVNAFEMYNNHDYINLHYDGKPDTWNVKPPLLIWMIVGCYELFGFNEFALRLPAALATVIFFLYLFRILILYEKSFFAMLTCIALVTCKGILGFHTGRAGDFDALLLCLLTISIFHFLLFIDFGKKYSAVISASFLGLAFYTKGTALFLVLPGMFLYTIISKKFYLIFRNKFFYYSLIVFLAILSSWILLLLKYGVEYTNSFYGSKNALETMFYHDTFQRFTNKQFDTGTRYNPFAIFKALDVRVNLWNYFFYVSVAIGLVLFLLRGKFEAGFKKYFSSRLILFSFCMVLTVLVILSFSRKFCDWYISPAVPFVMVITVKGMFWLSEKWKWSMFVFGGLLLYKMVIHFVFINSQPNDLRLFFDKNKSKFANASEAIFLNEHQSIRTYLNWNNIQVKSYNENENTTMNNKPFIVVGCCNPDFSGFYIDDCLIFEDWKICFVKNSVEKPALVSDNHK